MSLDLALDLALDRVLVSTVLLGALGLGTMTGCGVPEDRDRPAYEPTAAAGESSTSDDAEESTGSDEPTPPPATTTGVADDTSGDETTEGPPPEAGPMPIWIAASNYVEMRDELLGLGPFVVYAWASDPAFGSFPSQLSLLEDIDDPGVTEIIMLSSWTTLESVLESPGAEALHAAGVVGFGYNTEGMMTPPDQMAGLDDPSAQSNPVAVFSTLAAEQGFWTVWGPIRLTVDAVSDQAIAAMVAGGVRGVALQEQQPIEQSCASDRVAAVEATAARYRSIAGDPDFEVHVQVMPSRCANGDAFATAECGMGPGEPTYTHCGGFASGIAPTVDALAIWASSPMDRAGLVPLVTTLRSATNE